MYLTVFLFFWNGITTAFFLYNYTTFFYSVYSFIKFCTQSITKTISYISSGGLKFMNTNKKDLSIFNRIKAFFGYETPPRRRNYARYFTDDDNDYDLENGSMFSEFNTVILNEDIMSDSGPPFNSPSSSASPPNDLLLDKSSFFMYKTLGEKNMQGSQLYDFM